MTHDELYRKASQNIAGRRQKAESIAMAKHTQLYETLPELKKLNSEKNIAGAKAAMFSAKGESKKADEALSKAQTAEKKEQELLKTAGFNSNYLEPLYYCKECSDSGRHAGEVCHCVRDEMARVRRNEINRQSKLNLSSFESFDVDKYPQNIQEEGETIHPRKIMRDILHACQDWATEFGSHSESIYMFGSAGLGKTHLALAIASQVLSAGHDVIYVSAQSAFSAIAAHTEQSDELFSSMLNAELLVLDDLGTEYNNAYILSKLYELVNTRMYHHPTIYTTNILSKKMLDARYGEKITSRLLGECHLMRFWGNDIRLNKISTC